MSYIVKKLAQGESKKGNPWLLCSCQLGDIKFTGFADKKLIEAFGSNEFADVDKIRIDLDGKAVRICADV